MQWHSKASNQVYVIHDNLNHGSVAAHSATRLSGLREYRKIKVVAYSSSKPPNFYEKTRFFASSCMNEFNCGSSFQTASRLRVAVAPPKFYENVQFVVFSCMNEFNCQTASRLRVAVSVELWFNIFFSGSYSGIFWDR